MQWGYNINKQRINAEQTPKTEHTPAVEWKNKTQQKNPQQHRAGAGSLKHSVDLWHTFAPNKTEKQQMYGSVGKYEKTKKSWKRPRSRPFVLLIL